MTTLPRASGRAARWGAPGGRGAGAARAPDRRGPAGAAVRAAAGPGWASPGRAARASLLALGLGLGLGLAPLAAMAEAVVAALGDSITAGYGLAPEEGLVPRLEAWLRDRGHAVRLVNAGVSGDTTAGGLSRIDWTLTPEVDAVIVTLGGNDFLRGVDPSVSRANLDGILSRIDAAGLPALVIGLEVTPNYGPDYKARFDAMYPELARSYGALHHRSIFSAIEGDGSDLGGAASAFMQPDGIHPNAQGVARIVAAIGPQVEALLARVPAQAG